MSSRSPVSSSKKKSKRNKVPNELKTLIHNSVSLLGHCLREELGEQAFQRIEGLRKKSRTLQKKNLQAWMRELEQIQSWSPQVRLETAHAFGLMLELINTCETAYRTHRLRRKEDIALSKSPKRIVWVLTAHPTEARTPASLQIFRNIQNLLIRQLESPTADFQYQLKGLLHLAWHASLSKFDQPTVSDEAENICSILLRPEILEQLLQLHSQEIPVFFRTWVGGDKDGHPGVDEKTTLSSWTLSRKFLLKYTESQLDAVFDLLNLVQKQSFEKNSSWQPTQNLRELRTQTQALYQIQSGDALRVLKFRKTLEDLKQSLQQSFHISVKELENISILIRNFPGLVVPLEMREESEIVRKALHDEELSISKMLNLLKEVSAQGDPRIYVRALILSQTESLADMEAGWALAKKYFPEERLPVVPLLESEKALRNGPAWIQDLLSQPAREKIIKSNFQGRLEIMLGYSDSAKESGSLSSRFLIHESLETLEKTLKRKEIQPLFFHGSGGSVSRGGGPIESQMSWWTPSALKFFKATLQGEMIQRTLATPEIFRSQILKIASQSVKVRHYRMTKEERLALNQFQVKVQATYRRAVEDEDFLKTIEQASPYTFLHYLKIGSRPNKRKGPLSVNSLRAIPWVLCWTQMRILFPAWWGVGEAWQSLAQKDKNILKKAAKQNPLLHSYIHLLGFTLAKIELPVFYLYLERADLNAKKKQAFRKQFDDQYKDTCKAFYQLTGQKNFLWLRPWLGESITWRSPMIHPLNLLQIAALNKDEPALLRETVTGIASGMMTTG